MTAPEMDQQTTRRTISNAEHHRRRRQFAVAALVLALAGLLAVASYLACSGDDRDPRPRDTAGRARLIERESARAAATLERRRHELRAENAAVLRTMRRLPYVRFAGSQTRSVALTFDDGPGRYSPRILATLRRYGAKATFFTLGMEVGRHRLELHRAIADGHVLGNHSWSHADLTNGTVQRVRYQVLDANAALVAAGAPRPRLFRPPYGAYDRRLHGIARGLGMLTVMWSVDASDYAARSARELAAQVLADARPGSIILLHDGGGNRAVTARALPLIVRGLRRRRLRMLTVPQLLLANPAPADQDPRAHTRAR